MSLCCAETGRIIEVGEPLFACVPNDKETFFALCEEVVDQIPRDERILASSSMGGLNIHRASAGPNFGPFSNAYAWSSFSLGDFLFSISEDTVRKYIPNFYGILRGEKQAGKPKVELTLSEEVADILMKDKDAMKSLERAISEGMDVKIEGRPSH